jgi:hypothetical protein
MPQKDNFPLHIISNYQKFCNVQLSAIDFINVGFHLPLLFITHVTSPILIRLSPLVLTQLVQNGIVVDPYEVCPRVVFLFFSQHKFSSLNLVPWTHWANLSLGGTIRNITPQISKTHSTSKQHKNHINKTFHSKLFIKRLPKLCRIQSFN